MKQKDPLRFALFMVLVVTVVYTVIRFRSNVTVQNVESWVHGFGIWGPLIFIAVYTVSPSLFLPGSVLTLAGGALFGPIWGAIYSLSAATVGGTIAFFIARYLAADWVSDRVGGRLKKIVQGVNDEGWRFVAFVRLVPLFPFNLLNYALGVTRIRGYHYIVATFICMAPGAFAYAYIGYAGREVIGGGEGLITKGVLAVSLLAALALLPGLVRRMSIATRMPVGPSKLAEISTDELYQRLSERTPIELIDVRSEEEYFGSLGHIAGARLIPLPQLRARFHELKEHLDEPLAVICRTDNRSREATEILVEGGFEHVKFVAGGMKKWNQEGLPVDRDSRFS